jgi:hypothetical protein
MRNAKASMIAAALVFAFGFGYYIGRTHPQHPVPISVTEVGVPVPTRESADTVGAANNPLEGLEVVQWSFAPTEGLEGENTYEVSGELTNTSSQRFTGVYLDVALYDGNGAIVASSNLSASNIGPGQTGIIHGYVIDKTCTPEPKGKIRVSTAF